MSCYGPCIIKKQIGFFSFLKIRTAQSCPAVCHFLFRNLPDTTLSGFLLAPLSSLLSPLDPQVSLSPPPQTRALPWCPKGIPLVFSLYSVSLGDTHELWLLVPSVPMPPTVPLRRLLPKLPTEVPSGHREGPSLPCPESSSGLCSPGHFSLQLSECWPSPFSRPKVSTQGHSPLSHAHHTPIKPGRMDHRPHAGPKKQPFPSPGAHRALGHPH